MYANQVQGFEERIAVVKIAKQAKTRTKQSRKDMKQPDQFLEVTSKSAEWLKTHRNKIIITIAAIFLVSLGIYVVSLVSQNREKDVTERLSNILKIYNGKIETDEKKDKKDEISEGDVKTFASKQQKYQTAIETIKSEMAKAPSTRSLKFMQLYLAHSHFQLDKYKEAMELYQKYIKGLSLTDPLYLLGAEGILQVNEAKKQGDKGITPLKEFAEKGVEALRPLALLRIAEYYQRQQNYAQARLHYEKLSKLTSSHQNTARQRLAILP